MTISNWIDIAKIALPVIGAIWVYYRFIRERSHARRISFAIECSVFPPIEGSHVVEFVMRIKNQGLVIHRFNRLHLRIRGIRTNQRIEPWPRQPSRVNFPLKLIDEPDVLLAEKYAHIFVEPGVEQLITFVGSIPGDTALMLARAEFRYTDNRTHSTERVFTVTPADGFSRPRAAG